MEVISFNVGIISRRKGRSVVQKAAYCARSRLSCDYDGEIYDYTKRSDLVYHEILLPDSAPEVFSNQETLWNSVERIEKSRNARLAREVRFSLPKELRSVVQIRMTRQYVKEYFVKHGMCADVSIHDKNDGNPHVHLLLTTRLLDDSGRWMYKQRRNYLLDERGNRLRSPIDGKYVLGKSIKMNNWDEPERIEEWRKGWAEICNLQFKQQGIDRELTHISYARQGIEREPTKHLGAKVKALEERGIITSRCKENRIIMERNLQREIQRTEERNRVFRDYDMERER